MIRPGKMRASIKIQSPPPHVQFQEDGPWIELFKGRAQKKYIRSSEDVEKSGQFGKERFQFTVRYIKNITHECRVVEGDKIYDIVGIENVSERSRELRLDCAYTSRGEVRGI